MARTHAGLIAILAIGWSWSAHAADESIPRPEHPTPDLVRTHWISLNGDWQFRFDPKDEGVSAHWNEPGSQGYDRTIHVPFGWESELSGIGRTDYRGAAWYRRSFRVPGDFPSSDRVWLHFGAVDWRADVWINGKHVAAHDGGYSPFAADITDVIKRGEPVIVTVRAFDPTDPKLPTGKQVGWYTPTSGIWQSVWLESRPRAYIDSFKATTAIDPAKVEFVVSLTGLPQGKSTLTVQSADPTLATVSTPLSLDKETASGEKISASLTLPVKEPKLWTPDTPYLYQVELVLTTPDNQRDVVATYFGLRTTGRGRYGDAPFERLLLNGKPIFLRAALDQSFNPQGLYTAPSDAFLKRDLELAKSFGLNALRIHIKPDEPRRLYWADKLGLLILEDMPNTWEQNAQARTAWEATMREVIARDQNHPAIFAWVAFNETWGLGAPPTYKADRDTQQWVSRMVDEIRKLDPTRLVEDNSPCNYDHVENTDINSWHFYIDDHDAAKAHIEEVVAKTNPGSEYNYCPGLKQGTAPLINSEYGSIGAGSGDRDVSWGFRDLTTLLRRQPKIQGYVYTELDDIEWEHNGFVNYDRSPKHFGYDAFVKGMTVADLQGPDFIGYGGPPVIVAKPGEEITVPVFVSHYSERSEPPLFSWTFKQTFEFGGVQETSTLSQKPIDWKRYGVTELEPVKVRVSSQPSVGGIGLELRDAEGKRIAANFVNIVVKAPQARVERYGEEKQAAVLRFEPADFSRRNWSGRPSISKGKVAGQGRGFYEYRFKLPETIVKARPESIALWVEAGSKAGSAKVDWASRLTPQDYPQTDMRTWSSTLELTVNGQALRRRRLGDDPADARGVLSHLSGVDPGSYGEMLALGGRLSDQVQTELASGKDLVVRLAVPDDAPHPGGLTIYGAEAGAFPGDPCLVIRTKDPLPTELAVDPDASLALDTYRSRHVLLAIPGDSGLEPTVWAYTTTDPGPGWDEADFDDRSWKRGPAGFGTGNTPSVRVRTPWDSKEIWLRSTVKVPQLKPSDSLTLHLFHDEDVVIMVNGKILYEAKGYLTGYSDIALDAQQKGLFKAGANTVTVQCRQTIGGQGVDLGLILDVEP